jgi:hypothetical protein
VKDVLRQQGFSRRAASMIWDHCGRYPHRCLAVVDAALKGKIPDPKLNRLILAYRGGGPITYTAEVNNACTYDRRASRPCRCGGTLFDWGAGHSEDFWFVNWHCNGCDRVYTEYVAPDRLTEIRRDCKGVPSLATRRSAELATA